MSHCDPETLALRSLGEVVGTPEEDAHLAECAECQAELASLRAVVTTARDEGPVELLEPSPAVWERIRHEVGATSTSREVVPDTAPKTGRPLSVPVQARADAPSTTPSTDDTVAPVASLSEHRERRTRPATWLLAAAGVGGILVGGAGVAAVMSAGDTSPTATVAASVDLEPLPTWDAAGTAELAVTDEGQQVLSVTVDAEAEDEGYREVWIIDANVEGMVSLGILDGTSGEFVVPDGVDVADYPIVDVSLEPLDGDPTHSGDSIVRGTLEA